MFLIVIVIVIGVFVLIVFYKMVLVLIDILLNSMESIVEGEGDLI